MYIEAEFQKQLKTSAGFIDVTNAYDTIWRKGLIAELLKIRPCLKLSLLLYEMLNNSFFEVTLSDQKADNLSSTMGFHKARPWIYYMA